MQPAEPITIGKRLRKYMEVPPTSEWHDLDEYIELLKKEGAWINPCIKPAIFQLKNGLKYTGLMTTQNLTGYDVLARIPKHLLLSTSIALSEPQLIEVYKEKFFLECIYWEHRVLITYMLWVYVHKKGIWYHMVNYMSRDIDFVCLWTDQQADQLGDKEAKKASRKDGVCFDNEFTQWREMMSKYNVIPHKQLTRDNYKWLYAHIFSRCFGRMESITLVPFCQFFNHHNSHIFYDFEYKEGSSYKYMETKYDRPAPTPPDPDSLSSSNQSDRSYDYQDDADVDYSSFDLRGQQKPVTKGIDPSQTRSVEKIKAQLQHSIGKLIDWTDGSLIFVGQIWQKANQYQKEYLSGSMSYELIVSLLENMKKECTLYKNTVAKWYASYRSSRNGYYVSNMKVKEQDSWRTEYPHYEGQKLDFFVMRLGAKDYFYKNTQVFFRYGRLSNRKMLQCYGMTVQGNKYDHLWIRIDVMPRIYPAYPSMVALMDKYQFPRKLKFKLKQREFSMELVLYHRLLQWKYSKNSAIQDIFYPTNVNTELAVLKQIIEKLQAEASQYQQQGKLQQVLKDKSTSYHSYFATVYKLQHIRIINTHLRVLAIAVKILKRIQQGETLEAARTHSRQEAFEYWFLRNYLNTLERLGQH